MYGHIEKDISNAFNKLKITRDERSLLIETTLASLVETNVIVNRKTPKDFDSFHKL